MLLRGKTTFLDFLKNFLLHRPQAIFLAQDGVNKSDQNELIVILRWKFSLKNQAKILSLLA